jgi:hypothetical protein
MISTLQENRADFFPWLSEYFDDDDGKHRKIRDIEIRHPNRGERGMSGECQISPRNSSKGVIDRPNKLWQFIIAKLKKRKRTWQKNRHHLISAS